MKVIGIVENNPITGVKYGLIEIPDTQLAKLQKKHERAYQIQWHVRARHVNNCRTTSK